MFNKQISNYSFSILMILIGGLLIVLLAQNKRLYLLIESRKILKEGDDAYIFTQKSINFGNITLKNNFAILVFASTDCPGCRSFLSYISEKYYKYSRIKRNIILIFENDEYYTREYILKNNIIFPTIADRRRKIFSKYHIQFVPSIVLVGKDGKIKLYQEYGESTAYLFEKASKKLLIQ